jgi:AraC-like DNA-binding protein
MARLAYALGEGEHEAQVRSYTQVIAHEFFKGDFFTSSGVWDLRLEKGLAFPLPILSLKSCMPCGLRRSIDDIRSDRVDIYVVWYIVKGRLRSTYSSGTAIANEGRITVTHSSDPFYVEALLNEDGRHHSLMALVPAHVFRSKVSDCKDAMGAPLSGQPADVRLVKELFELLYDEGESLDRNAAVALTDQVINALGRIVRCENGGLRRKRQTIRDARLREIESCLELHLSDHGLSSVEVAEKCGISPRYLCYLLKESGTAFSDLLWDKRLDKSRELLRLPEMRHYNITEIAHMAGYKSSAHFSRSFRDRFGCPPREYRRTRTDPPSDPNI